MTTAQLRAILSDPATPAATRDAIQRQLGRPTPKSSVSVPAEPSPLEDKFLECWKELGGPALEREWEFSGRKFRFDFVHLSSRTAIEIDGAAMAGNRGRHTSKTGFRADCVKLNLAQQLGYRIFKLTATMINRENLLPIINLCQDERRKP